MVPLKSGFVESGRGGDMVGDQIERMAFQNGKRLGPDILEGRTRCDRVIGKEFEHLPRLVQVLLVLAARLVHPCLGDALGLIGIPPDVMNQTA
jgi:hypothetical protein